MRVPCGPEEPPCDEGRRGRTANADRAVHYLTLAGEKAAKHFAVGVARRYYEHAVDRLAALPESAKAPYAERLRDRLGRLAASNA